MTRPAKLSAAQLAEMRNDGPGLAPYEFVELFEHIDAIEAENAPASGCLRNGAWLQE